MKKKNERLEMQWNGMDVWEEKEEEKDGKSRPKIKLVLHGFRPVQE